MPEKKRGDREKNEAKTIDIGKKKKKALLSRAFLYDMLYDEEV